MKTTLILNCHSLQPSHTASAAFFDQLVDNLAIDDITQGKAGRQSLDHLSKQCITLHVPVRVCLTRANDKNTVRLAIKQLKCS